MKLLLPASSSSIIRILNIDKNFFCHPFYKILLTPIENMYKYKVKKLYIFKCKKQFQNGTFKWGIGSLKRFLKTSDYRRPANLRILKRVQARFEADVETSVSLVNDWVEVKVGAPFSLDFNTSIPHMIREMLSPRIS